MTEHERRELNQQYDAYTTRIEENQQLVDDPARPHELWDDDNRYLNKLIAIRDAIGHRAIGQLTLFEVAEERTI